MSKILNESQVYPGWELPKSEMFTEEKALLINAKQNFIFMFVKIAASAGLLLGVYNVFSKYDANPEQFNMSELLTLLAIYVFTAGLIGYTLGTAFAKIYKK